MLGGKQIPPPREKVYTLTFVLGYLTNHHEMQCCQFRNTRARQERLPQHPLLTRCPSVSTRIMQVRGRALLPATGFLEVLAAAVRMVRGPQEADDTACLLAGVSILAPLLLPPPSEASGATREPMLACSLDLGQGALAISTGSQEVHVKAAISQQPTSAAATVVAGAGLAWGPLWLPVASSDGGCARHMAAAALAPGRVPGCLVEPNVMDCCLQLGAVVNARGSNGGDAAVPVSVCGGGANFGFREPTATHMAAWI